jgi:uncharacterized protein YecE (DUF72 family)
MEFRIGCSGYYYPYWKDKFYPKALPSKAWLDYYSTVFSTVELNGTFYRMPKLDNLKRYAESTPEDFTFSVKMSRYITHVKRLQESRQSIMDFVGLMREGLGMKLSCVLFQMPGTFRYTDENLQRIADNIPREESNVVEFRHASWWSEPVTTWFANNDLTFCNVDYPGLITSFVHTSALFYLRLHGNPELFKSSYSVEKLEQFFEMIPSHCRRAFIYFNNTAYEAGYTNASQLRQIVSAHTHA